MIPNMHDDYWVSPAFKVIAKAEPKMVEVREDYLKDLIAKVDQLSLDVKNYTCATRMILDAQMYASYPMLPMPAPNPNFNPNSVGQATMRSIDTACGSHSVSQHLLPHTMIPRPRGK